MTEELVVSFTQVKLRYHIWFSSKTPCLNPSDDSSRKRRNAIAFALSLLIGSANSTAAQNTLKNDVKPAKSSNQAPPTKTVTAPEVSANKILKDDPLSKRKRVYDFTLRLGPPPKLQIFKALNKEMLLHPESETLYVYRGDLYLWDEEYELSIADFKKALSINSKSAKAHVGIARVHFKLGHHAEALKELDKALALATDKETRIGVLWEKAFVERGLHLVDLSLKDYDSVIPQLPRDDKDRLAFALVQRGELYMQRKQQDKAFADFSKAIDVSPTFMLGYERRSDIYESQNKLPEALKDLDFMISHNQKGETLSVWSTGDSKQLIKAYLSRARIYKKLGKTALAEKDTQNANKLDQEVLDMVPFQSGR